MKNQFTIEKTTNGFSLSLALKRIDYLRAFLTGNLTIELDKNTASTVSNALYTPKVKKPAQTSKIALAIKSALASEKSAEVETASTNESSTKTTKPRRAPRKKPAASAKTDK
jgi:hypothetical protein